MMDKKEKFIAKASKKHNEKYDYSQVNYIDSKTKVYIICPQHGGFWQTPSAHVRGDGCPKCGGKTKLDNGSFIAKAREIHSDKYIYSKVEYVNIGTKVTIICPEHGEYLMTPNNHLRGQGCPICGSKKKADGKRKSKEWFIEKANDVHQNKYDYSKIEYVNTKTKVCIVCNEHGEFWQTPEKHMSGQGCPKCGKFQSHLKCTDSKESFVDKVYGRYGSKYDLSGIEYINRHTKVTVKCKKHGYFDVRPYDLLDGHTCPHCGCTVSKAEDEIAQILGSLRVEKRNRTVLDGQELDLYLPELRLGIEYNGLRWHSDKFKNDNNYHLNKLRRCNERGVRLIQVFEDEWVNHKDIVVSKIKQICGLNRNLTAIYGRNTKVKEIAKQEANGFLDKNHVQGKTSYRVALGCFWGGKLIGVMTFKHCGGSCWELNRFATDISYRCSGIGGKLFSYFKKHYGYGEIKSFADKRWTSDSSHNLYTELGFNLVAEIRPSYTYYDQVHIKRMHKFSFRKQLLNKKYGFPLTMTESEMTSNMGLVKIWDCGLLKYVYKKNLAQ